MIVPTMNIVEAIACYWLVAVAMGFASVGVLAGLLGLDDCPWKAGETPATRSDDSDIR